MQDKTDEEIIHGILSHDNSTLRFLYDSMFGQIQTFVIKNNGTGEEAQDIFQEGLIALYQNLYTGKYQKTNATRLSSYFFQICKFKWYSVLRSAHKRKFIDADQLQDLQNISENFDEDRGDWDKNILVRRAMARLGENCRALLQAFYFEERSMKEIAHRLGHQVNSVKNAKYRCMQKLKALINEQTP